MQYDWEAPGAGLGAGRKREQRDEQGGGKGGKDHTELQRGLRRKRQSLLRGEESSSLFDDSTNGQGELGGMNGGGGGVADAEHSNDPLYIG